MGLVVRVDPALCMCTHACVGQRPDVFVLGGDEIPEVAHPELASEAELVRIAQECFSGAISVVKDGEVLVATRD